MPIVKLYGILSLSCAAASAVSFVFFKDDFSVGVLWLLSSIVCFYMRIVFKQDGKFDE